MWYFFSMNSLVLTCHFMKLVVSTPAAVPVNIARDATPLMPYDPNTTKYCSFWWDNDGSYACQQLVEFWSLTVAEFVRWNPSITSTCGNYHTGQSYCIEAYGEPSVTITSSFSITSVTSVAQPTLTTPRTSIITTSSNSPSSTPTGPSNGITTPLPIQPDMVGNCDTFYFAKKGDTCSTIVSQYGISISQFITWNPSVGSACTSIWANAYVCVSIIGHDPGTPTSSTPAPTATVIDGTKYPLPPAPTRTGTTPRCSSWYTVQGGDTCITIAAKSGITGTQLVIWNNYINTNCDNIWAATSVCVESLINFSYWTSLGCFSDNREARTLANRLQIADQGTKMTPKLCQDACQARGYKFSGVEYRDECYCDNAIMNNGPATTGCSTQCPGDTSEMCGGSDRINVYSYVEYDALGCWTDSAASRTLKNRISVPDETSKMTHELCQNACERGGYLFSGVEYMWECYCDNAIFGTQATGCNMKCAGNPNQEGGGSNRITISQRPQHRYVGCYSDSTASRTLRKRVLIPNEQAIMTVDLCRSTCRSNGYIYSGVEYGSECYCDNTVQTGVLSTGCDMACAGNSAQFCGGSNRVNIYSL